MVVSRIVAARSTIGQLFDLNFGGIFQRYRFIREEEELGAG